MDAQAWRFEWGPAHFDSIALHADDILFFHTKPETMGPLLMQIMSVLGETSGLYMNAAKSKVFPVNGYGGPTEWELGLTIATSGFK
ncbi:hypothetical protein NDU88_003528 [Pleurodeles waltl]|uniref:Reverse transcriptase domain-containing protein n=1 Tax=Pleurodeles waltl TaxID=8319 RepID=A0AAV7NGY3_PLEWA|nr:hypothetical protein NDU88_003528 [Pleurodeles waltl]